MAAASPATSRVSVRRFGGGVNLLFWAAVQAQSRQRLEALFASLLDPAFKGEL